MEKPLNLKQRALVLVTSIGGWLFAFLVFQPWAYTFYSPFIQHIEPGPKLFLKHLLLFSTPTVLVCFILYLLLKKIGLFPKIYFSISKDELKRGVIYGIAITIVTFAMTPLLGLKYSFHFNRVLSVSKCELI